MAPVVRFVKAAVAGIAALASVALVGWLGYAAIAWAGYGRLQVDRVPDPLVDRFMPSYEVSERHETLVDAPVGATYAAGCALDLQRSPVVSAIFQGRSLVLGARRDAAPAPTPFLPQALAMGWRILAEQPGREIVMGAVTQPWNPDVIFRSIPPDRFAAFHEPGYVKIIWTIEAMPRPDGTSLARTITRVQTTDAEARAKFRRYWAFFSPGILLIRYQALGLVRADAEASGRPTPPLTCAEVLGHERG